MTLERYFTELYKQFGLNIDKEQTYLGAEKQAKDFIICSALKKINTVPSTITMGYKEEKGLTNI